MYRDRCDKCGKLSKYVFRSKWDTALYIMHFCKITNTLTRPIRVSVLTCWRFWIDWEGLLIRVAVMLNPIYWSQALSPMSLSDRPLALMHTHTHTSTHTHTHKLSLTFMQEIEISQADTQAWTKCQRQATGREEEPLLIIAGRNHTVSPARHAIQDICGSWSHFLFFPPGIKPRGDTISTSGSLKAVISFVMDVFFSSPQAFFFFCLRGCVVCTSLKRIMTILSPAQKNKKWGVNPSKDRRVGEKLRRSFAHQNVTGITDIVWSQTVKLCLLWQGAMQSFWKGVYKFLPSATLPSHLILNAQEREKKTPALFFFFWQHVSRVTLNLWRFPILSDHSLFGSC